VPLPGTTVRVVVRHNRHGGLFAGLTRDFFLAPTRAPRELTLAQVLRERGVPTPDVVAYAVYPPGGLVQRSDVCSQEITGSRDLAEVLVREHGDSRFTAIEMTAALVATLSRAGARHQDLNAKNVLLDRERAYVLDVDRVAMGEPPTSALEKNLARLVRSLRKWRELRGAPITEPEIARLDADARHLFSRG
jgi:3-deoxy-D-manno-octulosonic acid kinase